jgi:hypothetical protein
LTETSALGSPRLARQNGGLTAVMRDDRFQFIPDADDGRRASSVLNRIYRDIGLAAVAEALRLPTEGFEPEMIESLERGEFYLLPPARTLVPAGTDA